MFYPSCFVLNIISPYYLQREIFILLLDNISLHAYTPNIKMITLSGIAEKKMPNLHHIFTVAKVEAKLLRRSITIKIFWLISLLSIVFIVFFPQYGMWSYDSFLPGMQAANCFFFFSILKILLSPFLSPVFIYEDSKNDSYEALSPRPFYNLSYMFGKMFGFTSVMLVTDYFFMFVLYIYYLLNYNYSSTLWPYLLYPIIITIPLSIFVFGMNAFAARIRYHLVYLMPIVMVLVFLPLQDVESKRFLDLGALTIPLAYSAVTGFYNVKLLIIQRLIFVFAGIGFVISASLIMETVRHSFHKKMNVISGLLIAVCFIASAGFALLDQKPVRDGIALRDTLRVHQNTLASDPHIHIDSCHLDVSHNKSSIDVIAEITVSNPNSTSLSQFFLNLNPGFKVKEITPAKLVSDFKRELNTIEITLDSLLRPNEHIELEIAYNGSVDKEATYLHIPESFRERNHRTGLTVVGKQVAFIEPNYVILPAEVNWYPSAVHPYQITEPGYLQRDLTTFSLDVSTREGLTPIFQGEMTEKGSGVFSFTPETALTQVSLTIGEYKKLAVTADSVEYSYHWLEKDFVGRADVTEKDVIDAITSCKNRVESSLKISYPFKRFQIVQTPVHYFGYNSALEMSGAYDQPEVSFVSELPFNLDTLMVPVRRYTSDDFIESINVMSQLRSYLDLTFCKTVANSNFIESKINPTSYIGLRDFATDPFADYGSMFTQYIVFSRNKLSTDDYFNLMAVNWLRSRIEYHTVQVFDPVNPENVSIDRAEYLFISSKSLNDIIFDEKYHFESLDILNIAPRCLFNFISMTTDTDRTDIEDAIYDGLQSPGNDLADELSHMCGADVLEIFNDFSNYMTKAHYEISDITVSKHILNNHIYHNARYKISNPTPYVGYVSCSIHGPSYETPGGTTWKYTSKYFVLEPFTQKEVGLVTLDDVTEISEIVYSWFPFSVKDQRRIKFNGSVLDSERIELFDDIRVVESGTAPFEVVIDNLDDECRIINPPKKIFLKSLVERHARGKGFRNFTKFKGLEDAPDVWILTKSSAELLGRNEFYGQFSSCYYTKAGDGNSAIEYAVGIPEPGNYQVFLSYPNRDQLEANLLPLLQSGDLGETTVRVFTEDGIHEDVCDIRNANGDWALVGTYSFADTTAVIQITDKTNAKIVIADAIKLKKSE